MAFDFQVPYGWMLGRMFVVVSDIPMTPKSGGGICTNVLPFGTMVKVTMVSRMDDVGITTDLNGDSHQHRVYPFMLAKVLDFSYPVAFDEKKDPRFTDDKMFSDCYREDICDWDHSYVSVNPTLLENEIIANLQWNPNRSIAQIVQAPNVAVLSKSEVFSLQVADAVKRLEKAGKVTSHIDRRSPRGWKGSTELVSIYNIVEAK
jgi:hypothetical protein